MPKINYDYPCKKCGHSYEDHVEGLRCSTCWSDAAFIEPQVCLLFVGDNLKYLKERYESKG